MRVSKVEALLRALGAEVSELDSRRLKIVMPGGRCWPRGRNANHMAPWPGAQAQKRAPIGVARPQTSTASGALGLATSA